MIERSPLLVAGVAMLAFVAASVGWVTQWQRAQAAEERVDELAAEVEALRAEVAALERRAAQADDDNADDDGSGGLFDGLLGDGGILGELLGGDVPGARCLTPDGGNPLDGLFGGGESLPDDPEELVEVVADQVAELRDLEWQQDVDVDFVDGAELTERLEVLLDEDTDIEGQEAEQRLLSSLGAIPADLDLVEVQRDLLDEQVAGYYHPESGDLVVRVPDGGIRPIDGVTLAHELQHALADQTLGLPDLRHEPYASDADALLGALALIEGDATLLMQRWMLEHVSLPDQLAGALGGDMAAAQASLDAVPHHLQRELLYPYTDGLDYVCEEYLEGGWAAVDAGYGQPPTTSYEVLFPGDGPVEPRVVPDLAAPSGGSELMDTTFGAAPLLWLFEAPGGETERALDDPRDLAAAWAGGRAHVWDLDGETVAGLSLVDGDGSLCASMADWHQAAFPDHDSSGEEEAIDFTGPDAAAVLRCEGDSVRYVTASELDTAAGVVTD